jgi:hypothetical protein
MERMGFTVDGSGCEATGREMSRRAEGVQATDHRRGRDESDLATIGTLDDKKPKLRDSENQSSCHGQMQVPDSRGPANGIVMGFGIVISRSIIPRVPRR